MVNKSTNLTLSGKLMGVDISVSYYYNNDEVPSTMMVSCNAMTDGISVSARRNYTPDGGYSPVQTKEIGPLTLDFDNKLKEFILAVFANYQNPGVVETEYLDSNPSAV